MPAPADILRNCAFRVEGYVCKGTLYGTPMRQLKLSSRTVFTAHDMPYVVKVEFGYSYRQSWNEWVYWHDSIKNTKEALWFAATHGLMIGMIESEYVNGSPQRPWYVVASLQERILDAGKAFRWTARKGRCLGAEAHIERVFPDLVDIREHQFVYSARLGHGVLVDYGMHGPWDDATGDEVLDPPLWAMCVADMHIGEWRMFDVPHIPIDAGEEEPNNDIIPARRLLDKVN